MLNNQNNGFYMPVMPAGYGYGYGGGNGLLGGDVGLLALAFLFYPMMMMGGFGGWGGMGMGGIGGLYPWLNQADQISDGFANQANTIALNAVQSDLGDMQTQLCGGFAGVTAAVNGAQSALAQQGYNNQIAELQQGFALQQTVNQGFNQTQAQLAQCCCDNRLATANLQSVIQAENCADRAALSDAVNLIRTDLNNGFRNIHDQLCEDTIVNLRTENNRLNEERNQAQIENYVQNALIGTTQYLISQLTPAAAARTTTTATA